MAPRNIFHASPLPEFHNVHLLNPPNANPQRHIGSTLLGSNEHTIMNFSVNFPHLNTANSGAICDNYQHPVFTVSSNQTMPYQTQNVPYCYNQNANQTGATLVYPPAENSRVAFKRKTTAHPVYENPYRYQDENIFSVGEGYQRNVRIRHSNTPRADLNPAWQSSSSRPTQLFHSSASISAPPVVGGQWHHTSLPGTYSQWNHPTNAGYLMNQSVSRNCVFGGATQQNSAWNSDNSRNSYSGVPNSQGSNAQSTWAGPISYDQRQVFNRTSSNYTNLAAAAVAAATVPLGTGSVASSRIPRATNLQSISTNRVPRNFYAGWPTFITGNGQRGWISQGLYMTDVPPFAYALDLFDEHRDLRLDIDNMSYEELLSLEETIGSVNTGLSEDHVSRCLTERTYCSSSSAQDDQDKASCPICLEEFMDKDSQGVLKCHHVYHVTCIKNWLGLKKNCPLCKAPALDDDVKQKQKVSL